MASSLIKTGLYSFLGTFILLIVFLDRQRETTDVSGLTSGSIISYPDYFFMIIKYSLIVTLAVLLIVFIFNKIFKKNVKN